MKAQNTLPWTPLSSAETDMLAREFLETESESDEQYEAEGAALAMVAAAPAKAVWPLIESLISRASTAEDLERIAFGVFEPFVRRFGQPVMDQLRDKGQDDPQMRRAVMRMRAFLLPGVH